jgi:hypothetical protein
MKILKIGETLRDFVGWQEVYTFDFLILLEESS